MLGEHRVGELGCGVVPAARGRGVATEALRLLADWAFDALGLGRLQVFVAPENVAALRLVKRAGFRHEGVLRAYWDAGDDRLDAVVLSAASERRAGAHRLVAARRISAGEHACTVRGDGVRFLLEFLATWRTWRAGAASSWREEDRMGTVFKGTVDIDIRDSHSDWAPFEPPRAPDGAPSVVYIVLDDVGFSAMSCYGGPIETPNIDKIAADGCGIGSGTRRRCAHPPGRAC